MHESGGGLPVARLVSPIGAERVLPPLVEITVGRMSTADFVVDNAGCSRLQCTLTFTPPDAVVFVQKGSNSTRLLRLGADPIVFSTKPNGLVTERLRHGDIIVVPQGVELKLTITAPQTDAEATVPSDTELSDVADAASVRSRSEVSDVDVGNAHFDDDLAEFSDESDDFDAWEPPQAWRPDDASIPSGEARAEVIIKDEPVDKKPPRAQAARGARKRRKAPESDSDGDREEGNVQFIKDDSDVADIKREHVPDLETFLKLHDANELHVLTAPVLRAFLREHGVAVQPSMRKADLLMHATLFLSGAAT